MTRRRPTVREVVHRQCAVHRCRARVGLVQASTRHGLRGFCASCRETARERWAAILKSGNPWKHTFQKVVRAMRTGEKFRRGVPKGSKLKCRPRVRPRSVMGHVRRLKVTNRTLYDALRFAGVPIARAGVASDLDPETVDQALALWRKRPEVLRRKKPR